MQQETRVERRLNRWLARATTPRGAAIVIATTTTAITLLAGFTMRFLDEDNYPSVWSGLWWAVQTVTTVGYGDDVPVTVAGRLVAALVMLLGIGFLTVITAVITSAFVSRSRATGTSAGREDAPTADLLREINARLERIEAALEQSKRS